MTEAHIIGGMFVGMGFVACLAGIVGLRRLAKRERFWGGLFRGWLTKTEAPIAYQMHLAGVRLSIVFFTAMLLFGLWVMVS